MKKFRFIFSLAIISLLFVFTSCDEDIRYVEVEYEYQLIEGTHPDVTGTIQYVNSAGNLVTGGSISKVPFKSAFQARRGFGDPKMVVTFNPITKATETPIVVSQRVTLEVDDFDMQLSPTYTFNTVEEYNNFCKTPQNFYIEK